MSTGRHGRDGREALWVFFGAFIVGLVVIGAADRLFDFGPALGTALFVALPLVAATAAASRLDRPE